MATINYCLSVIVNGGAPAAEKFRISASLTVELSFDDLIWLWYCRLF